MQKARVIFDAALAAVRPDALLAQPPVAAAIDGAVTSAGRVVVVGAGKAAMVMAGALERRLGGRIDGGSVTVPHGYPESFPTYARRPERVSVRTASHPVPDAAGAEAAHHALTLVRGLEATDTVLALISGGGSALWPAPVPGVSLVDLQTTTQLLLASGAPIGVMNAVRKHLSRTAGGRFAEATQARVLALVLSDVPGDDPSTIASGPTVPDSTTFADVQDALHTFGIWKDVPVSIRRYIRRGQADPSLETPKPGAFQDGRVRTHVIGTNGIALAAAKQEAVRLGYGVTMASPIQGEARLVGTALARHVQTLVPGTCLLAGGESTVTLRGTGTGGRNQELAAAAALELAGGDPRFSFLSAGTDGIDGPTDAAGAVVDAHTAARAAKAGVPLGAALARNDTYPALDAAGALLRTGPTHTNVMDLVIGLAG
ncbi:MAG: DUF4147 domain-containing protein [Bacteroidota bacterium]